MGNCCDCMNVDEKIPLNNMPYNNNTPCGKKYVRHRFYPKTFQIYPPLLV